MRVRRIKRLILIAPYIVVIVPIILCIILFSYNKKQNDSIDEINEELTILAKSQEQLAGEIGDVRDSVEQVSDSVGVLTQAVWLLNDQGVSEEEEQAQGTTWPQKVYLTFDDGPSANTSKILDILDHYGVKATFFVVGTESAELRNMYRRIVNEGHTIGMHSYSHKYSEIYASEKAFSEDFDRISELIFKETGVRPKYYRFPGGSSNNVSRVAMDKLVDVLNSKGITYFDWNVVAGDATNPILPAEQIIENSLCELTEYKEAIILFHDLSNKTTTVDALPTIIEAIQEMGVPIEPIDDSTMLIQHNTNTQ